MHSTLYGSHLIYQKFPLAVRRQQKGDVGELANTMSVIPVDRLAKRGYSERGQREVERESDCFRNE